MFDSTAYMRRYRAEHPDYVKRHKRSQKTRAERNQAWIYEYLLQHPCVDCGEKDPLVLEFDHIGDDKSYEVTSLTSLSLKRIQEEIAKCEVTCANDHRRRTAQRANSLRWQLAQKSVSRL